MTYEPPIENMGESVAVIGSGVAGSLSAHELTQAGYQVTILEQLPEAFSGSSANAAHLHLGGLYSANLQTAKECLVSAVEMKKAIPHGMTNEKVQFLVAEDSDMSLDDLVEFHEELTDYYANLPSEDQVFGLPENFFRVLRPEEYAFAKRVAGGLISQEVTLNMAQTREKVLAGFIRLGGRLLTNTKVIEVEQKSNGRFGLVVERNGHTEALAFDQVVNAAGYGAGPIDHQLGDRTQYSLVLKTWNVVRNNGQAMPPFAIVRGNYMTHYPYPNQRDITVLNAQGSASRLDHTVYDANNATLPTEWDEILRSGVVPDAAIRQAEILEYAGDQFLTDASALEPIRLVPGVAVAYSTDWADRTQKEANIIAAGWQTVVPTKASHGLRLAREVVGNAVNLTSQRTKAA
jgi:hypothetical protein